MIRASLLLLLLSLAAVAAEDFPTQADRNAVQTCLAEKAKSGEAAERCIGVIADPCLETGDDPSTYGMAECSRREHAVWDERLNRAYRRLLSAVDRGERARLREMQRAWIAFEEKKCGFHHVVEQGTAAIPAAAYCSMLETGRQALFLEQVYGPEEGR